MSLFFARRTPFASPPLLDDSIGGELKKSRENPLD